MDYLKKKVIIPTIALVAILGAVAIGTMPVSASGPVYGNLVQQIAQRFNLSESDVQKVFDDVRVEHQQEMKTNWDNRLSQLVTDGKITDAQKNLIIAKHNEIQTQMDALRDLSPEERHTKMQEISDSLKQWASDNNIDLQTVGLFGMHAGFGRGFMMGYRAGNSN